MQVLHHWQGPGSPVNWLECTSRSVSVVAWLQSAGRVPFRLLCETFSLRTLLLTARPAGMHKAICNPFGELVLQQGHCSPAHCTPSGTQHSFNQEARV